MLNIKRRQVLSFFHIRCTYLCYNVTFHNLRDNPVVYLWRKTLEYLVNSF